MLMKKIFTLLVLCVLVACNKKTTAPAPPSPAPASTTTTMSSLDSCMMGDWALDSTVTYYNAAVVSVTPYTDPVNCHLVMTAVEVTPGDAQLWKKGTKGLDCTNTMVHWRTNAGSPDKLDLSGIIYTIVSSGGNTLIIQYGSISPTGGYAAKYYLHK
jgi:hypothetical protein